MSTNALIIVKKLSGRHACIRVQWDGYTDGVGSKLFQFYNSQDRADALVRLGDISQLEASIGKPKGHTFGTPVKGYTIAYKRDRGDSSTTQRKYATFEDVVQNESAEYVYYWDGVEWFWYKDDNNAFYPLKVLCALEEKAA